MTKQRKLKLAFSGGGFRAMFYCLGAYRRLVELGLHSLVSDISSVSGGSITAGAIMTALSERDFLDINDFDCRVTGPLRRLGQINVREKMLRKAFFPSITNLRTYLRIELPRTRLSRLFPETLDEEFFHGKRMIELPKEPEWSCNATCLNTMKRFRFKVTDIYGNLLGSSMDIEDITVAFAVAASAAFPMMFAPLRMDNRGRRYHDKYGSMVYPTPPEILYLTDGGVYDNLGSENILKEDSPFVILDASATATPWEKAFQPGFKDLNARILETTLEQNVLLRRRLIYKQSNGIQLLINRPVYQIVESEKKYRELKILLPEYPTNLSEIEELIGGLRTDLDSFHDVEIDTLIWSGAIRIDLAVKTLLPEIVPDDKWYQVPSFPDYPMDKVVKVLKRGQNRKYFGKLHRSLHT
ncbi:patatin-like phospholipase family protein [Brevibacillus sp. SAFN-007a]|uniref:patatin-like phospholipase family protein n=1 Tax=Brevibacillus sp. SAFN-007a TaxID=3436862 RepID=UPI003F7DB49D